MGVYRFTVRAAGPPEGRLVILLHGFPQSSLAWRHQLDALAGAGYRAVAPDQRGYSAGARPDGVDQYRIDHLVADVVALADEMGGHQFDVVGHDWGAGVAWYLAGRYPDRLRTLTAVSVPHPAAFMEALQGGDQALRSSYIGFFRQEGLAESAMLGADGRGLRALLESTGLPEAEAEEYVALMRQPEALTAALNWYRAVSADDLAKMGPVTTPTLYLWSDQDPSMSRKAAEACALHVEGPYRFEVITGVGHWVPETAPDQLDRFLLEHLSAWD